MKKFTFCLFLTSMILTGFAQQKKVLADKIIATVGDKIILKSEIENNISDMQRQGMSVPENANCLLLEQALGVKALMLQAEKDSLPLPDDEVDGMIDLRIRNFIAQYGSKDALEQIAGRSIFQLKEDMRAPIREQKLAELMRNKIIEEARITPAEVQAYFAKIPKDSLKYYETEIEVGQIIIYPKASHDLDAYAIDQLKEYKQEVENGTKKFETLASLYTDDPGSKDNGGKYEINRNEKQWEPVFLAKAFSLKEGQVSSVFKTKFGYHIIQMVSRAGDDATIRHILKIPEVTSIEIGASKLKLDSVRAKLIAGTMKFPEAVAKYSDDETSKFTGGRVQGKDNSTFITLDELDKNMVLMMKDLTVGQYSQPTEFTDDRGKKGVRLVQLISKTEPHRENLRDDYNKISQRAIEEKKNKLLDKWFVKKIPTYYINIDKEYQTCPEMQKWVNLSTASN